MEIRWGKQRSAPRDPVADQDGTPDVRFAGRPLGDHISEIIENHARDGGFDNLEGKGQPLNLDGALHEDYYLTKVMKNAHVLPKWLELQHEIRDAIAAFVQDMANKSAADNDARVARINEQIKRYNRECPSAMMQKPLIQLDHAERQLRLWE